MNLQKLLCTELKRQLEAKGPRVVGIPAGGELLWQWFLDLNKTRTYHMAGPNPIGPSEILAYSKLTGWGIEARHVTILRAMDAVWIDHAYEKQPQAPDGVKTLPQRSGHNMTAGMFDAMFG
ncbi:hypothetical protein [Neorhizobium sp. T25_13]|uniref:phage tail assembly chaperone n=1 Tax=Neorhizobium sp. T25_13 TaxID=2093830 RepID=UPI000CF9E870|nr:hypothetical protein [Neorhizobium sp. T25_13]